MKERGVDKPECERVRLFVALQETRGITTGLCFLGHDEVVSTYFPVPVPGSRELVLAGLGEPVFRGRSHIT